MGGVLSFFQPLLQRAEAVTCDEERVDYVFVYAPRVGLRVAPVQVLNYSVAPEWWHSEWTSVPLLTPDSPTSGRHPSDLGKREHSESRAMPWLSVGGLPGAEASDPQRGRLALSDHRAVVARFKVLSPAAHPSGRAWRRF